MLDNLIDYSILIIYPYDDLNRLAITKIYFVMPTLVSWLLSLTKKNLELLYVDHHFFNVQNFIAARIERECPNRKSVFERITRKRFRPAGSKEYFVNNRTECEDKYETSLSNITLK